MTRNNYLTRDTVKELNVSSRRSINATWENWRRSHDLLRRNSGQPEKLNIHRFLVIGDLNRFECIEPCVPVHMSIGGRRYDVVTPLREASLFDCLFPRIDLGIRHATGNQISECRSVGVTITENISRLETGTRTLHKASSAISREALQTSE